MKLRCKPNDLALITKAIREVNVGRIVECKEYLGYFQKDNPVMYSGEQWAAQDTGHIWVVFSSSGIETQYGSSKVALMMDHWLMPIGANKNDQVVETKVQSGLEFIK